MKTILSLTLFVLLGVNSFAQDTIFTKLKEKIVCRVVSISSTEINFKNENDSFPEDLYVKNQDVEKITYANGITDVMGKNNRIIRGYGNTSNAKSVPLKEAYIGSGNNADSLIKYMSNDELYELGVTDAQHYYKHARDAGTTAAVTTAFGTPFFAWLPCLIMSAVPVSENNLGFPDDRLYNNTAYRTGYREKANRTKSNKVWKNFGIVTSVYLGLILLSIYGGN